MFTCILLRRKLHESLGGSLSDIDKLRVEEHLKVCSTCSAKLHQIKSVLSAVEKRRVPEPDEAFWHTFKAGLDHRLNQRLLHGVAFERRLSYQLKPVLAYALLLLFVLGGGVYFTGQYLPRQRQAEQEQAVVADALFFDELGDTAYANSSADAVIEDIGLLEELGEDLT